jgi:rubrerythrin
MVSIRASLRRLLGEASVVYECRECGTTLEYDAEECPSCGSGAISRYDLD